MLEQAIERLTLEVQKLREVIEKQNVLLKSERAKPAPTEPTTNSLNAVAAPGTDGLLDETAVSKLVGLSLATVRRWRLFRTGPPYRKLGSAVRYSRAEVLAWLDAQRVE